MDSTKDTENMSLISRVNEAPSGPESGGCWRSLDPNGDRQGEDCTAGSSTEEKASATTCKDDDLAVTKDDALNQRTDNIGTKGKSPPLREPIVRVERLQLRVAKRRREVSRRTARRGRPWTRGTAAHSARPIVIRDDDEESASGSSIVTVEDTSPEQPPAKRRGRGRPPTTGEYVGLAKAKEEFIRAKRKEREMEEEEELLERYPRLGKLKLLREDERERTERLRKEKSEEIAVLVLEKLEEVDRMAKTSRNIKGTYVKLIRDIVTEVRASTAVLLERTGEMERKEREEMREEIVALKKEIEVLREEVRTSRIEEENIEDKKKSSTKRKNKRKGRIISSSPEAETIREYAQEKESNILLKENEERKTEEITGTRTEIVEKSGDMIKEKDIELNIVERIDSLLEKKIADLLAIKNKEERLSKRGEQDKNNFPLLSPTQQIRKRMERMEAHSPALPDKLQETERIVGVERRETREEKRDRTKESEKVRINRYLPRQNRGRRTTAIALQVPDGSYASVLQKAKNNININELGIEKINIKDSIFGGRILEIGGDKSREKAEKLTSRLKDVLGETDVRIRCIKRMMEVQIWNLDETITTDEIKQEISKVGNCAQEDVNCGRIRQLRNGTRTMWMRLPAGAAQELYKTRQLKLGWCVAKITMLEKRPLQCYACLEFGHLKSQCNSKVNRSDKCYKCGESQHLARECTGKTKCMLCADRKIDSNHRMGSNACASKSLSIEPNIQVIQDKDKNKDKVEVCENAAVVCTEVIMEKETQKSRTEREMERLETSFKEAMDKQVEDYRSVMEIHQPPLPQRGPRGARGGRRS